MQRIHRAYAVCLLLAAGSVVAIAQNSTAWDKIATDILEKTGVPSASIAVVRDGKIVYAHAYGYANLEAKTAAQPTMRYSIGSVSKQFTAAALLLLQERGKLSLDDPVGKYVPGLTEGNKITIRQVLSMTSGYRDFWPQDYVMPPMQKSVTPQQILNDWAKIPLDFEPGTKWQYSNTNYVIAGQIAEKLAGKPLFTFLRQNVFAPLDMKSVTDQDEQKLTSPDPTGYMRYALGPLHPAPKEGSGWMYAAGELAMTAEDLAKWDIALIDPKILRPASFKQMETEVLLASGAGTGYGLGVDVKSQGGHRLVAHSGEVSGFVSQNLVFPDDRVAVAVLTNQDAIGAASQIAAAIAKNIFEPAEGTDSNTTFAEQVLSGLQEGKIDRPQFTSNCNAYFDATGLEDYKSSLGPLGKIKSFTLTSESLRGGMTHRRYRAVTESGKALSVNSYWMPDGKIEQFIVTGE